MCTAGEGELDLSHLALPSIPSHLDKIGQHARSINIEAIISHKTGGIPSHMQMPTAVKSSHRNILIQTDLEGGGEGNSQPCKWHSITKCTSAIELHVCPYLTGFTGLKPLPSLGKVSTPTNECLHGYCWSLGYKFAYLHFKKNHELLMRSKKRIHCNWMWESGFTLYSEARFETNRGKNEYRQGIIKLQLMWDEGLNAHTNLNNLMWIIGTTNKIIKKKNLLYGHSDLFILSMYFAFAREHLEYSIVL